MLYFSLHSRLLTLVLLLSTVLSPEKGWAQAAEIIDGERYPHVQRFFQSIDLGDYRGPPLPESERWWCPAEEYIDIPQEVIERFLRAAAKDHLTVFRWLALMSKMLHAEKLALCACGDPINQAMDKIKLDMGLGMPMRDMGVYAWLPQYDLNEPERMMRLNLIYRKSYIHRFPAEVLPVDLKMGYGKAVTYLDGGQEAEGFLTAMDFYVSDERIGFDNVTGLGARRRGAMGFLQNLFFFLPDDVYGLYVEDNQLVANALMNMQVPDFETTPKYQMRIEAEE